MCNSKKLLPALGLEGHRAEVVGTAQATDGNCSHKGRDSAGGAGKIEMNHCQRDHLKQAERARNALTSPLFLRSTFL